MQSTSSPNQISGDFISAERVAAKLDITTRAVQKWTSEKPDFPKPVKITRRCTRWSEREIDQWLASLRDTD